MPPARTSRARSARAGRTCRPPPAQQQRRRRRGVGCALSRGMRSCDAIEPPCMRCADKRPIPAYGAQRPIISASSRAAGGGPARGDYHPLERAALVREALVQQRHVDEREPRVLLLEAHKVVHQERLRSQTAWRTRAYHTAGAAPRGTHQRICISQQRKHARAKRHSTRASSVHATNASEACNADVATPRKKHKHTRLASAPGGDRDTRHAPSTESAASASR